MTYRNGKTRTFDLTYDVLHYNKTTIGGVTAPGSPGAVPPCLDPFSIPASYPLISLVLPKSAADFHRRLMSSLYDRNIVRTF